MVFNDWADWLCWLVWKIVYLGVYFGNISKKIGLISMHFCHDFISRFKSKFHERRSAFPGFLLGVAVVCLNRRFFRKKNCFYYFLSTTKKTTTPTVKIVQKKIGNTAGLFYHFPPISTLFRTFSYFKFNRIYIIVM